MTQQVGGWVGAGGEGGGGVTMVLGTNHPEGGAQIFFGGGAGV